jgi:Uma2 family endonuclease
MIPTAIPPSAVSALPDHTQLPSEDETNMAQSLADPPQAHLLTASIRPILNALHPDGQYCTGSDLFVYWKLTSPYNLGVRAPDWFYVPNVPPGLLKGKVRRSYVMWQEKVSPFIAIEFVSGDGSEERDRTPETGKFWIYEQGIRAQYYAIYEREPGRVELYQLINERYQTVPGNSRGHYPVKPLGVELGIWQGEYAQMNIPWLRWWKSDGDLLLADEEALTQEQRSRAVAEKMAAAAKQQAAAAKQQAAAAKQQAATAKQQAADADQRKQVLADKLRQLGVDPDTL